MQVVGGPNSTDEGMNKINTRGKSRENCSLQFWPTKLYQRGNLYQEECKLLLINCGVVIRCRAT